MCFVLSALGIRISNETLFLNAAFTICFHLAEFAVLLVENKLGSDASMFDILNYDEDEDINLIYENPNQNYVTTIDENINIHLMFESLRSRCRHTKQKDTGTAIAIMKNANIEPLSIYKQINSMRETNEFHEFCSEKLFTEIVKESKFSDIVPTK